MVTLSSHTYNRYQLSEYLIQAGYLFTDYSRDAHPELEDIKEVFGTARLFKYAIDGFIEDNGDWDYCFLTDRFRLFFDKIEKLAFINVREYDS
jgi:hypothetical protein